jgi:hypothetical protein
MREPALKPAQFRQFVGRSLQAFLEDWTAQHSANPEVFAEALSAHDWLDAFSEFALAEVVNPPSMVSVAEEGTRHPLGACGRGR